MTSRFVLCAQDFRQFLAEVPSSSIDLVVTDPPYASLEKHRAVGTTTRLTGDGKWFPTIPNDELLAPLMTELWRVLKPDTHCYVFCDDETSYALKPAGEAVGFKYWKRVIWDKQAIGMGYHWRNQTEDVLFFEKGKHKLNNLGLGNLRSHKRVVGGYPTEKPVSLLAELVENSSQPDEIVLDPFVGSGSCGEAALRCGRRFVGNDLDVETARARLEPLAVAV